MSILMNYQSLGHLPNAPLVYVVGMIEYAEIPKIADNVSSIQDALRHEFPEILPPFTINKVEINLKTDGGRQEIKQVEVTHWAMNTIDRSWGIVFSQNRLILQTSHYNHFDDFSQRFRMVMGFLAKIAEITHTSNLGIRYIDNIIDIDGLKISTQLGQGFLSPELTEEFKPVLSRVEHVYKSSEGHLFLRCYGLQNQSGIPEDVRIMANQIFREQNAIAPIMSHFAILDTDHIFMPHQLEPFDIDQVINRLGRLHEGASKAFRTAVTDNALNVYGKRNVDAKQ